MKDLKNNLQLYNTTTPVENKSKVNPIINDEVAIFGNTIERDETK